MPDDGTAGGNGVRPEDVHTELATAFGLFVLSDASIHEAAEAAGVSPWELEDEIERAGLTETLGLEEDRDVSATIDDLLEEC
ncbi:hypothetical protein SAMN05216226_1127 [Halovenus aranensis]|jgi:hypothetical protein|uniref:Uncharacterized protein n=1 Tax=Halovenus aranensis TaxID=890420 RepID=A0A1G8XRP1_9EURY|nr:hypothetical protein [Halovenus aranensis]SDJ92430.1 hypothetical protein SAMN05216226_1127 [Halovenus aranensis]